MSGKYLVREKNGRWVSVGSKASALATAMHNSTRTGVAHEVGQIDKDGNVSADTVRPGNVDRPVNGNQVFRSTSRGK